MLTLFQEVIYEQAKCKILPYGNEKGDTGGKGVGGVYVCVCGGGVNPIWKVRQRKGRNVVKHRERERRIGVQQARDRKTTERNERFEGQEGEREREGRVEREERRERENGGKRERGREGRRGRGLNCENSQNNINQSSLTLSII